MGAEEARSYRRGAARVNYMAQDRPDLAYVANLLSRSMSRPKCGDEQVLKRVGRYLITRPRLELVFRWQPVPDKLQVLTDSDWGGCRQSRRSTSGTVVRVGSHLISFACKLQKAVALSSGEAELCAQVSGISDGLGIQMVMKDFGFHCGLVSCCDSSAARGALTRAGVGRMKHLTIKHLWVQGYVDRKELEIEWIPRARNPSDLLTHKAGRAEFEKHLRALGCSFVSASLIPGGVETEEGC